jgi:hypothetical protein
VLIQVQGGKAPEESLILCKQVPHLGRFANDEQGHHGACLEDGDKELELLSTVGKVVDIGNHDQFGLAFEEALHAIDALCNHESDLHLREHYTDTAGSTEQVFALTSLLGIRFAPRIRDALSRKLYVAGEVDISEPLNTLLFERINTKLIVEQWDERYCQLSNRAEQYAKIAS